MRGSGGGISGAGFLGRRPGVRTGAEQEVDNLEAEQTDSPEAERSLSMAGKRDSKVELLGSKSRQMKQDVGEDGRLGVRLGVRPGIDPGTWQLRFWHIAGFLRVPTFVTAVLFGFQGDPPLLSASCSNSRWILPSGNSAETALYLFASLPLSGLIITVKEYS